MGGLAGAFPDVDIFIRSAEDPLLAIEFHRHFTHSLIFVPVIGLIFAAGSRLLTTFSFWRLFRWATLGALTHGLLDACTSYGTHLLWPFSQERTSWHIISVIDPVFTLPLLLTLILAYSRRMEHWARIGMTWCCIVLLCGYIQRERATDFYRTQIAHRGDQAVRLNVKPGFANLWLWRGIYESDGHFTVDAIWNFPFREPRLYPGGRVRRILPPEDFAHLSGSTAYRDVLRFDFFSDQYLYAIDPHRLELGDLRFSLLPNSLEPLWVIRLDPDRPHQHLPYLTTRNVTPEKRHRFVEMLRGL